jgi:hypothetical protein
MHGSPVPAVEASEIIVLSKIRRTNINGEHRCSIVKNNNPNAEFGITRKK